MLICLLSPVFDHILQAIKNCTWDEPGNESENGEHLEMGEWGGGLSDFVRFGAPYRWGEVVSMKREAQAQILNMFQI